MRTTRLAMAGSLVLLVGCDHVTKYSAKSGLEGVAPHEVIHGVLDLRYAENRDIAFNLLRWIPESARAPGLIVLGAVTLIALIYVLFRRTGPLFATLPLMLITAGAIGNYADRVWRGYVVDFLHVQHWPVFNVADMYVTMGMALLVVSVIKARNVPRPV